MSTLFVVTSSYYSTLMDHVIAQYSKDAQLNISQINMIIDLQLAKIVDSSNTMMQDRELIQIFEEINPESTYELISANRKIKRIISKYFSPNEWLYSSSIFTDFFRFGEGFVPHDEFYSSDLSQKILSGDGRPIWYPTFEFVELFQQEDLRGYDADFRRLFSFGRVLHGIDTTSVSGGRKSEMNHTLVLLLCFRESFFHDFYANLLQDNDIVFIITPDGQLVSANDAAADRLINSADWLNEMLYSKNGVKQEMLDEQPIVLSYSTSNVTGWTLVSFAYKSNLLAEASSQMLSSTIGFIIPLALISLVLAGLVSLTITRPMRQLFNAFKLTGKGDFSNKIPVLGYGEFSQLITQFNDMNDRIAHLINENYTMKIHEKDSQIKALNAQLNPHFVYNTLNLINCMAIENGVKEIANVVRAMSKILRYTIDNMQTEGLLSEELQWLDNYVYIMSCRYEGQIDYICDVDQTMLRGNVPRLFLQPFVENAFVHGFKHMQEGCRLTVVGFWEENMRCFMIMDNGCGFSMDRIESILSGEDNAIGISNTCKRMQLMYEGKCSIRINSREGEGTQVMIKLPIR